MRLTQRIGALGISKSAQIKKETVPFADRLIAICLATIPEATIVVLDNVAELFHQSEKMDWGFADFPNAAPPFNICFYEWDMPNEIITRETGAIKCDQHQRGMLSIALPLKNVEERAKFVAGARLDPTNPLSMMFNGLKKPLECRWLVLSILVMAGKPHWKPVLPGLVHSLSINDAGVSIEDNILMCCDQTDFNEKSAVSLVADFSAVMCLGNSLMHCKNVIVSDETATPSEKQRQHRIPRIVFKTLAIDPFKTTLRKEGSMETNGLKKALHICRGHFRSYDENSTGLFGRGKHGTFWIPQHTRGKKEFGKVVKDYKIG